MSIRYGFVLVLAAAVAVTACAKTQVSDRQILVEDKQPRPDHIYVAAFVSNPADVPADSALAGQAGDSGEPQTADAIALGQKIGNDLANALVSQIAAMGLPALRETGEGNLEVNDLLIRGYLLTVDSGNAAERVGVGMGMGAAELKVAVEGFQMTSSGLRKLGSGTVDTTAGKTPGAAVGLAGMIVTKNPIGLIVGTGMKLHDEADGSSKLSGKVEQVAEEIANELKPRFQKQGWI